MRPATLVLASVLFSALLANGVAADEPFSVKPGLWQMDQSYEATAEVSPGLLRSLTPGHAADLKRTLTERVAKDTPEPRSERRCISQGEIRQGISFPVKSGRQCRKIRQSITATTMDTREECTGEGSPVNILHVQALGPEAMRVTISVRMQDNEKTVTVTGTIRGRWIGQSCTGVR